MCAQKRLARGGDVKKCAQKSRGEGNVRTFAFGEVARRRGGEVARWRFHPRLRSLSKTWTRPTRGHWCRAGCSASPGTSGSTHDWRRGTRGLWRELGAFGWGGAPIDAPQYLAGAAVASARRAASPPRHAPLAAAPHPAGSQRAHAILDSPATTCGAFLPNTLSLRACRLAKQVRRRGTHGQTSLSRQDPSAVCDRTFESAVRRV